MSCVKKPGQRFSPATSQETSKKDHTLLLLPEKPTDTHSIRCTTEERVPSGPILAPNSPVKGSQPLKTCLVSHARENYTLQILIFTSLVSVLRAMVFALLKIALLFRGPPTVVSL